MAVFAIQVLVPLAEERTCILCPKQDKKFGLKIKILSRENNSLLFVLKSIYLKQVRSNFVYLNKNDCSKFVFEIHVQ